MKIRKNATQKNFIIDKAMYSFNEINEMLALRKAWYFSKVKPYAACYEELTFSEYNDDTVLIRMFTYNLVSIDVKCTDGYYHCIAVDKFGKEYYVIL